MQKWQTKDLGSLAFLTEGPTICSSSFHEIRWSLTLLPLLPYCIMSLTYNNSLTYGKEFTAGSKKEKHLALMISYDFLLLGITKPFLLACPLPNDSFFQLPFFLLDYY